MDVSIKHHLDVSIKICYILLRKYLELILSNMPEKNPFALMN